MLDEEILKKAIEKARKNGYIYCFDDWVKKGTAGVIFSHDFAKAFWGERYILHDWRYYLQVMVLRKYPIKYLEKFI